MPVIASRTGPRLSAAMALALSVFLAAPPGHGQDLFYSSDITMQVGGGVTLDDDEVGLDTNTGDLTFLEGLPQGIDVVAFHAINDALPIFVVDQPVELPGGVYAEPRDVISFNGEEYSLFFEGVELGLGRGVGIDALTFGAGSLFLSFDVDTLIGEEPVGDEDILRYDGKDAEVVFKGLSSGVPKSLDVDAISLPEPDATEAFVMSFDIGGQIGEILFDDDDLLIFDGDWELYEIGTNLSADFVAGDLDALAVAGSVNNDIIFLDGFESGDTSAWDAVVP